VTRLPTDARHADRLPCGVHIDDLLAQVADDAAPSDPEHQRTCQHCRATLAELTALWRPVHDLAAQDVRAPSDLLETVMAHVRRLPRTTWHATIPDGHGRGRTRIAARVIAAVARLAAQSVPEVTLALGSGHDLAGRRGEGATDVAVSGSHVVIDVQIVVDYGAHLPDVARQVRAQIAQHITALTGLTTAEVNVNVADIRTAAR
jgi:uncharacterized alkaline shock family protein YloU